MKHLFTLFLAGAAFALTGCAVHTPSGSVVVDPRGGDSHSHGHGGGKHCPPGQAKKGNC